MAYSPGDIQLSLQANPTTINGPMEVKIILTEKRDVSKFLHEAYLVYPANGHFLNDKEYLKGRKQVSMTLRPNADAGLDTLKSTLYFELKDKNGRTLESLKVSLDFNFFRKKLFEDGTSTALRNILLFGMAGSSKSSFINSCYSMLSDSLKREFAKSGGSDVRVTTEFVSYRLIDVDKRVTTRYRLWDTWGIERNNYKNQEFAAIVKGTFGKNTKMEDRTPVGRVADMKRPKADEIQHSVIFFIPANEVEEGSELANSAVDYITTATKLGLSSIVVLTKFDSYVSSFPYQDSSLKSPEVSQVLRKASNFFNLSPNRVFPLVNYFNEDKKSFEIDRVIYRILQTAADVADSFIVTNSEGVTDTVDDALRSLIDG